MERRCVIVAFGDILGFGTWSRRAAAAPEIREPFIQSFYETMENFVLSHDCYVKYLGDGVMVLRELSRDGSKSGVIHDFIQAIRNLTEGLTDKVNRCEFPPPEGYRARMVSGYVDKILVTDPNDHSKKIPEYVGYAVNLCQRLLEIDPQEPFICHESVTGLLGPKIKQFVTKKVELPKVRPRGVDAEDVSNLLALRLRRAGVRDRRKK